MRHDDPDQATIRAVVAQIFPGEADLKVERVPEGVSTYVYRLKRQAETLYLRVLPEDASFAPEVHAHTLLREQGVRVPEVVFFEHRNPALDRSLMVTTEIPGTSIETCHDDAALQQILFAAGHDIALANSVPVQGFGWIKRDRAEYIHLEAEDASHRGWIVAELADSLAVLEAGPLDAAEVAAIRTLLARYDSWLDEEQGWLAHGDFDVTHIFQQDGRYTGIIDWGEMRGASRWYDLGHFRMHDGERQSMLLSHLLAGYATVSPLPADYWKRICFASLLIAVRAVARSWSRHGRDFPGGQGVLSIRRDIAVLATPD